MLNRTGALCLLAMAVSTSAFAGDLNPPAGPVTATGRFGPRTEINAANTPGDADSLFKITQPGSYYLGSNITGALGKHGIEIAAEDVTLDLDGFTLFGVPGSLNGIHVFVFLPRSPFRVNIANGTVTGWGGDGVLNASLFSRIDALVSANNGGRGIQLGSGGLLQNTMAVSNGGHGILVGSNSTLINCYSAHNANDGYAGVSSTMLVNCAANNNMQSGFQPGGNSVMIGCIASLNVMHGFFFAGGHIENSRAYCNSLNGINAVLDGSLVRSCSTYFNGDNGVRVEQLSEVVGCTSHNNGVSVPSGSGILATILGNRLDGNHASQNPFGITVTGTGTLIIRNSATANTTANYSIGAGNSAGPIVTSANIGTNSNPHANYQH